MSPWFLVLGVRFQFEINKFGGGWVGLGEKVLVPRGLGGESFGTTGLGEKVLVLRCRVDLYSNYSKIDQ